MIFALSPQAKGRVERVAGTFQDRLVTELRLVGARVVLKAFLEHFNERFGVPAQEPEGTYCTVEAEHVWTECFASGTVAGWQGTTR